MFLKNRGTDICRKKRRKQERKIKYLRIEEGQEERILNFFPTDELRPMSGGPHLYRLYDHVAHLKFRYSTKFVVTI